MSVVVRVGLVLKLIAAPCAMSMDTANLTSPLVTAALLIIPWCELCLLPRLLILVVFEGLALEMVVVAIAIVVRWYHSSRHLR